MFSEWYEIHALGHIFRELSCNSPEKLIHNNGAKYCQDEEVRTEFTPGL